MHLDCHEVAISDALSLNLVLWDRNDVGVAHAAHPLNQHCSVLPLYPGIATHTYSIQHPICTTVVIARKAQLKNTQVHHELFTREREMATTKRSYERLRRGRSPSNRPSVAHRLGKQW